MSATLPSRSYYREDNHFSPSSEGRGREYEAADRSYSGEVGKAQNKRRCSMSVEEALAEIQAILGKGLPPTAVPKVRGILNKLKEASSENKE
jgi:hypothetical protein